MSASDYFNPIPLFILFREAIEASIVVSVLLTFVSRSNPKLKSQIWWGVGLGVAISLLLGAIFAILYYKAQQNLFQGGNAQFIFKGVVAWVAAIFITFLAFAMLRYKGWEDKWARKLVPTKDVILPADEQLKEDSVDAEELSKRSISLSAASDSSASKSSDMLKYEQQPPLIGADVVDLSRPSKQGSVSGVVVLEIEPANSNSICNSGDMTVLGSWWSRLREILRGYFAGKGLFLACFMTVLREGLESVIFLFGVGNASPLSIPISGLIGILCGLSVGVVIYYSGKKIKDIKWLLWIFAAILFCIAAGSCENGARWLMQGGMFGPYIPTPTVYTSSQTGAISSRLYGTNGAPAAPSAASLAASGFNDGDEGSASVTVNLNDGYVYMKTSPQPWWQAPIWDISNVAGDKDDKNRFLSLMKVIFGYNSQPCFIDVIFYLSYWFVILCMGLWKWQSGSLIDADYKYKKMMIKKKRLEEEEEAAAHCAIEEGQSCNESKREMKPEKGQIKTVDTASNES